MSTPRTQDEVREELSRCIQQSGAQVQRQSNFAQRYKLDFTVTGFEGVYAHINMGVHIDIEPSSLESLTAFAQGAKRGIAIKMLYIEIDPEAIEEGGIMVAMAACMAQIFNREAKYQNLVGVKIHTDCTYSTFDVNEEIERITRSSLDDELVVGDELEGRIIAYFTDKGFGFIQTDDEIKFFFHIANIADDELRSRLPNYVPGEIIHVDFQYGGTDGKKYPKAVNILYPLDEDDDLGDHDEEE